MNLADLLTKVLTSEKRWEICWNIMWWQVGEPRSTSLDLRQRSLPPESTECRWLHYRVYVLPLMERMFVTSWSLTLSTHGDPTNADVVALITRIRWCLRVITFE
jgi:hypothetical protein